MRLAAELDSACLYSAAAYVSMAGDSIGRGGGGDAPARERQAGVDLDFTLDGEGRVWMIREGDCQMIGRTDSVCAQMRRFLAGVAAGGDGSPRLPPGGRKPA